MLSTTPSPSPLPHTYSGQGDKSGQHYPDDNLLQLSRRVDWRFLYPNPHLGRVAYMGSPDGELVCALEHFSASLTVGEISPQAAACDVVVIGRPTLELLQAAAACLVPGGYLYAEIDGGIDRRRRKERPLRTPQEYVAAAEHFGFTGVEAYWHWPNFTACTKIIPLGSRAALLFALEPGGIAAPWKAAIGRMLLRAGLLPRLVPCFSLVAVRGKR